MFAKIAAFADVATRAHTSAITAIATDIETNWITALAQRARDAHPHDNVACDARFAELARERVPALQSVYDSLALYAMLARMFGAQEWRISVSEAQAAHAYCALRELPNARVNYSSDASQD